MIRYIICATTLWVDKTAKNRRRDYEIYYEINKNTYKDVKEPWGKTFLADWSMIKQIEHIKEWEKKPIFLWADIAPSIENVHKEDQI